MKVEIAVGKRLDLPLNQIHIMQGELKSLSKERYEQLKNEILTLKFSAPFYIWKDPQSLWQILDGTQRKLTLLAMEKEGYQLPAKFPCIEIFADSLEEAAQKLLGYISQYGQVEGDGLREFIHTHNIKPEDLITRFNLPNFDPPKFIQEHFDTEVQIKEKELDENLSTEKECPSCGYVW